MAKSDKKGKKGTVGKATVAKWREASAKAEVQQDQTANIEVGDFISELATAVRYRASHSLHEGDWLEEPERAFTDGRAFAQEVAVAAEARLQVTLSLDASSSMWGNLIMGSAGMAMVAMDRMIRKALADLPEGTVRYAPFIFHSTAHRSPAAYLRSYTARLVKNQKGNFTTLMPTTPSAEQLEEAKEQEGFCPWFRMYDADTKVAPLFEAIKEWEEDGDPDAVRLDIVITDGVFDDADDVARASRIQEERNGRLITVMLNFLDPSEWSTANLPDRCVQYAVNARNLNSRLRDTIAEAIEQLM